ncbi:cytochrome c-type biogenesis protein CcmH [Bradyrhizobium sp. 83012]|uniref:Cytochrome c-type biogenesis protein n=1 Tax=Bradyrhizobium aeschynomenes TaxID=2734909 RepID=A0ABX2CMX8_9BRAD|nr:cytochrome c-type biogenesis protein [Bradyrhizobium aeschynomenes]NPU15252.1 cytochrome c-type biogenesis protein CcmH [Bradyrhizobium aeschynomenes]NPU69556.1 cytochrome c-type biogenesis protein CcmH [Bradyrhizobium aeschynomenes]NPV24619.1 cytochrome c-type biogenesis protein CcmH [Bradyrhizobium aeschynomenes]
MTALLVASLALAVSVSPSRAVLPDEMLRDERLEARARALGQELRCVVCQNQSIDDSNAPLAHDLRVLLRDRLQAGDSDRQAVDFLVARYGNFVLLKPPLQWNTIPLWIGPLLALLSAIVVFGRYVRRASANAAAPETERTAPLSADELEAIEAILDRRSLS